MEHSLSRVGGVGLMGFALLSLGREFLDVNVGPPPSTGAELVSWMAVHEWALGSQSEVLFFALGYLDFASRQLMKA